MIRNIFKQLWSQRQSNGWIAAELLLVSVFLWVIVDKAVETYDAFHRPMGFDIENTYLIYLNNLPTEAEGYVSPEQSGATTLDDLVALLARLRKVEGVEAVSSSSCARPYSPCNGGYMFMAFHHSDTLMHYGMYRNVTPEYFKVFRILTPEGSPAGQEHRSMVVLSKDLADTLQVSRGDSVYVDAYGNRPFVTSLCTEVRYAETWPDVPNGYIVWNETETIMQGWFPDEISIRLRDGMNEEQNRQVWERIKEACNVNNLSFFYAEPFVRIRKDYLTSLTDDIKTQGWYAGFLLVNIFLGIVGTFWFHTQRRRGEVGLRLAVGASRAEVFKQLIGEGMLLLVPVMAIVVIIMLNAWNLELLSDKETVYSFIFCGVATWLLMAMMVFLGIWYPARQAMKIQPAEALHEE